MAFPYGLLGRLTICLLLIMPVQVAYQTPTQAAPPPAPPRQAAASPRALSFEPNAGQAAAPVRFQARTAAGLVQFLPGAVALPTSSDGTSVQIAWRDAAAATLSGQTPLPGRVSYLHGSDPAQWQSGLPTYAGLTYAHLYPGVDLTYTGTQGQLKGTYVVAPGSDPTRIRWQYTNCGLRIADCGTEGVQVQVDSQGELQISVADGRRTPHSAFRIREAAPVAWQDGAAGRQAVTAQYSVAADGTVGFTVGPYDPARPLIIDPTLDFSTYFGGVGSEAPYGSAVDAAGDLYLTGYTNSSHTFPLYSAVITDGRGYWEAYVTKLAPDGQTMLFSTYLAGTGWDVSYGIALDAAGNSYVTGETASTDFPTLHPYQAHNGGGDYDGFLTKFSPQGQLLYSTYLGGSGSDRARGVGVDAKGNICVAGFTSSPDFPRQRAAQNTYGGGLNDGFVTAFTPDGASLLYSTYLGGSADETLNGLAVDAGGRATVTGWTVSADFPVQKALQRAHGGGLHDAFVTRLAADGTLDYSTYLGGNGMDDGQAVTVDASGAAYVTGWTASTNFPTVQPIQDHNRGGASDVFISKLDPAGAALVYSTYLGGSTAAAFDIGVGIAVDANGAAYVVGRAESTDFPLLAPLQPATGGGASDAFIAKLTPAGSGLIYSTYLGGQGDDMANTVAIAGAGAIYVAGQAYSLDFPLVQPFQTDRLGTEDLFVAKLSDTPPAALTPRPVQSPGPIPTYAQSAFQTDTGAGTAGATPEAANTVGPPPTRVVAPPPALPTPMPPAAAAGAGPGGGWLVGLVLVLILVGGGVLLYRQVQARRRAPPPRPQ